MSHCSVTIKNVYVYQTRYLVVRLHPCRVIRWITSITKESKLAIEESRHNLAPYSLIHSHRLHYNYYFIISKEESIPNQIE